MGLPLPELHQATCSAASHQLEGIADASPRSSCPRGVALENPHWPMFEGKRGIAVFRGLNSVATKRRPWVKSKRLISLEDTLEAAFGWSQNGTRNFMKVLWEGQHPRQAKAKNSYFPRSNET